jgi:hypothetical protein
MTCYVVKDKDANDYLRPVALGWSFQRRDALRFADRAQAFDALGYYAGLNLPNLAVFRLGPRPRRRPKRWVIKVGTHYAFTKAHVVREQKRALKFTDRKQARKDAVRHGGRVVLLVPKGGRR